MINTKAFDNFKSSAPSISGHTTINHNIRVKLGMNCSEYVMMDFIQEQKNKGIIPDVSDCWRKTGFKEEEQTHLIKNLIMKNFIEVSKKDPNDFEIREKWKNAFKSIDDEFEIFWHELNPEKHKFEVCWTGSKPLAKSNFLKVRKKYAFDFLLKQRSEYFEFLKACHETGFPRQKMMCTVFLGPQERFLEDFAKAKADLLKSHKKEEKKKDTPKAVSMDQVKDLYSKNEKNTNK